MDDDHPRSAFTGALWDRLYAPDLMVNEDDQALLDELYYRWEHPHTWHLRDRR